MDLRTEKEKLFERIIEHNVKNHHPITEERYQFVEWLYRIRKHHGNHYGFLQPEERYAFVLWLYRIRTQYKRMGLFQPDFICIIFGK